MVLVVLSATTSLILYKAILEVRLNLSQMVKHSKGKMFTWITEWQNNRTTKVRNGWNFRNASHQQEEMANLTMSSEASRDTHTRNLEEWKNKILHKAYEQRVIRILTWTDVSGNNPIWFRGQQEGVPLCDTPIPCEYSSNHSLYNISDVIMFHTRHVSNRRAMPSFRLPHQHWMTYLRESPTRNAKVMTPYNTWFNWTIAYTMNADIIKPYGICLPNREKVAKDPSSITDAIRRVYGKRADSMPWVKQNNIYNYTSFNHAEGKTRLVLWAVSNCRSPSRRENYVNQLKRHIKVDIVGKCADNERDTSNPPVTKLLRSHTFYLSFENSICPEYITEKVWQRMYIGILPIVLGGADYKSFLRAHSYIDVKDFASPEALAAYLHKLDKNDHLYNEYFAWKRNYTCQFDLPGNDFLCNVCRFMNENLHKVNIIPDAKIFWNGDICFSPEEYYRGIVDDI